MTGAGATTIVLADDHALVRRGLRLVLESEPDLRVVAEAENGAEAVEAVMTHQPAVAILDVGMPRLTGLQAARELEKRGTTSRLLLLSVHENEQYLCEAAEAGASGYVLKSAVDREMVQACRGAVQGAPFICPSGVSDAVRERVKRVAAGEASARGPLSDREVEVLKLIAEGFSAKQIAAELFISEKTVDRHRANVFAKLELRDRVDVARYAIRTGLVDP